MSTYNYRTQAPVPNLQERPRQAYWTKIASGGRSNTDAWATRRKQELRFEEGLASDPAMAGGLHRGAVDAYSDENRYEHQQAATRRSRWSATNPHPTWTDESAYLSSFQQGSGAWIATGAGDTPVGEAGKAIPYPFQPRDHVRGRGAEFFGPRDGLNRGERQNTIYATKIAPANGGRRRNEAEAR